MKRPKLLIDLVRHLEKVADDIESMRIAILEDMNQQDQLSAIARMDGPDMMPFQDDLQNCVDLREERGNIGEG